MSDIISNVLSFDLELWSDRENVVNKIFNPEEVDVSFKRSIVKILSLLEKYDQKATFFTLGYLVKKFPELYSLIHENGHEIGIHGWDHKRLDSIDAIKFDGIIKKTKNTIQDVIGEAPHGYRAPQFSLSHSTSWVLDVLEKNGIQYDSSIFPVKSPLYGSNMAPTTPYYPNYSNPLTKSDKQEKILELPLLTNTVLNHRFAAAGGFWLRLYGTSFVKNAIRKMNQKGYPTIIYLHNWELDKIQLKMDHWKSYYGLWKIPMDTQLESLLDTISFDTGHNISEKIKSETIA